MRLRRGTSTAARRSQGHVRITLPLSQPGSSHPTISTDTEHSAPRGSRCEPVEKPPGASGQCCSQCCDQCCGQCCDGANYSDFGGAADSALLAAMSINILVAWVF
jgi:hypothetical protein